MSFANYIKWCKKFNLKPGIAINLKKYVTTISKKKVGDRLC